MEKDSGHKKQNVPELIILLPQVLVTFRYPCGVIQTIQVGKNS